MESIAECHSTAFLLLRCFVVSKPAFDQQASNCQRPKNFTHTHELRNSGRAERFMNLSSPGNSLSSFKIGFCHELKTKSIIAEKFGEWAAKAKRGAIP